MLQLLWWGGLAARLTVEVSPPQEFKLELLRGGNYACLDVPQERLPASFKMSGGKASAQVGAHKGVLATVRAQGELITDCVNVFISGDDQAVKLFLLTELEGDTVVLQHENDIVMNLFAEFHVGDEYCLASYLQPVCRGALYSSPAEGVEMIQLEDVDSADYLWFLDGVASLYTDPQPLSAAKFLIKYYSPGNSRPVAALRQPFLKKGAEEYVSWLAFCSDGSGKVAYFGAWFDDADLHELDRSMPPRGDAQFPDTRYCKALWKQINNT